LITPIDEILIKELDHEAKLRTFFETLEIPDAKKEV
jgi:hypothetical protein